MVNSNIKYRWDFLGLSTDNKPTPEESNKVVNGSTYYETDTSKLYVFYKDQWYERKPLGGGGGGGSDINVVQTTGQSTTDVMSQKAVTDTIAETVAPLDSAVREALTLADTANDNAEAALAGLDTKEDAGVVFDASTDYAYATMSNALGNGLVYVTTNGTNRLLVTHTSVVESERDITLYVENSSGTYTGQLAYRWIDGEAQPVVREYVLPTGGTTGQILAKRSNVTGDVQWTDAGGAKVQVNSTGEFGQTREGDNLISFSDNGTNVDMQMAKGSTANNLTLATKDYVDSRTGMNLQIDVEKWCGTYTDENGDTYQVYSKVIYIPALSDTAGITTYPHGITGIKQILDAYGFTTDGFVLNAPRQNIADNIAIYQVQKSSTGGIAIEVGKDRSSKKAYVTLIYAKNN